MPLIAQNESVAARRELNWTAEAASGSLLATTSTWFWDLWQRKPGGNWSQLVSSDPIRGSTVPTATLAPTSPAATLPGDLVIVTTFTVAGAGVPTHTLQSGFTQIISLSMDDGSTDGRLSVAYHDPSGGDNGTNQTGAQAFQAYTSSGGTSYSGIVVLKKGYWTVTGIQSASAQDASGTSADPPSVTLNQKKMVLIFGAWHMTASATVSITPPANYTEIYEMAGSNAAELSAAYRLFKTASGAAENPAAFTDDVTPNQCGAITIAITMTPATQENFSYDDANHPGDVKYTGLTASNVDTIGQNRFKATNTGSTSDCKQRDIIVDVTPSTGDATAANQTTIISALGVIDDFLDTEIAAIKAKTDNLPSDPADASDIAASFTALNTKVDELAGLLHKNARLDNTTYNANGFMTSARLRVFASAAACNAATDGAADDADGETLRYLITSVEEGVAKVLSFRLTRVL